MISTTCQLFHYVWIRYRFSTTIREFMFVAQPVRTIINMVENGNAIVIWNSMRMSQRELINNWAWGYMALGREMACRKGWSCMLEKSMDVQGYITHSLGKMELAATNI